MLTRPMLRGTISQPIWLLTTWNRQTLTILMRTTSRWIRTMSTYARGDALAAGPSRTNDAPVRNAVYQELLWRALVKSPMPCHGRFLWVKCRKPERSNAIVALLVSKPISTRFPSASALGSGRGFLVLPVPVGWTGVGS